MSIHTAAKEANIIELERLLSEGKNRDSIRLGDDRGNLPLHVAVKYGQQQTARLLLQRGADEYAQTANAFKTALHIAAATDNMFFIDLLDKNRSTLAVKARDMYGYTPLHTAVRAENDKAVVTLLQRGADMEAKSKNGETALLYAVRKGSRSIVNLLLEKKADVHARDKKGNSVLHKAKNWETYKDLRRHCDDFLQKGKFPKNHNGQTPLHLAAKRGDIYVVEDMCRRGANPAKEDEAGHTPLHFAREGLHVDTIRYLMHRVDHQSREAKAASI